jgi:hypothetical protein
MLGAGSSDCRRRRGRHICRRSGQGYDGERCGCLCHGHILAADAALFSPWIHSQSSEESGQAQDRLSLIWN